MDDIHKRADDEAIEKGLSGKALAALQWFAHGYERRGAIRRRRE
jgi:hypothetical protein